jgi:hypothetical protein
MTDEVKAVEFVAEIRQVKTMADHTVNVTYNFPEYCTAQAAWHMQHQGEMIKGISLLQSFTNGQEQRAQTEQRATGDPLGVVSG